MMYNYIGDNMIALITGASSGIGKDIAINLSNKGYDLILVSRSKKDLEKVKKLCCTNVIIEPLDLSDISNCKLLYEKYKNIDILINNAGFGLFGEFYKTNLDEELNMIDLNIKTVHILTKLYLKEMIKKDSGRILNVASTAAFFPGPLMDTYYSTKSYVLRLTVGIYEELRRIKSNVKISVLCPGPVDTNFNRRANVKFAAKALTSNYVAKYAVDKMFKNKLIIIPGVTNKICVFLARIMPYKLQAKIDYNIQKQKEI